MHRFRKRPDIVIGWPTTGTAIEINRVLDMRDLTINEIIKLGCNAMH